MQNAKCEKDTANNNVLPHKERSLPIEVQSARAFVRLCVYGEGINAKGGGQAGNLYDEIHRMIEKLDDKRRLCDVLNHIAVKMGDDGGV